MADLIKARKIRAAYKGHVTRVDKELILAMETKTKKDLDVVLIQGLKNSYVEKLAKIKEMRRLWT